MSGAETVSTRGPDVRVPPPLVYVAGFVATWLLNQRMEFLIDGKGARPPQVVLGAVILGAGLALMLWGLATFWRARTAVVPIQQARQLVTWGPYRFTRNPMYVGLTFAYFGLAIVVNWAWAIVFLPVVLVVMNTAVIEREERYLHAAFPEAYGEYCQRARRWL
jgi:protein-S-isoprenylcysteine O-methyltransferase Ste14